MARLSGVMIVGFLTMTIANLIEVFYIGQVGKLQVAAYSFAFPVAMCMNALTRGIGIGAAALIAQGIGRGDPSTAARAATHGFVLVIIFTVSVAVLGQYHADVLFGVLGATGDVLSFADQYAAIWLIGFPMMGMAMVANGMIRAFGDATYPGLIMTSGPIAQIVAGPFLIFGLAGLPALGLEGAAWAFNLGCFVQLLLVINWFVIRQLRISPTLQGFIDTATNILKVGIPAAATNLINPFFMVLVTFLLASFGPTVVAGFGVAARLEAVAAMVVVGISGSVVPMVGQNWGAGRFERVIETMKTCYVAGHTWGITAAIIMWLLAPFFVSLVNDDPALIEAAVMFLYIVPISIGFMGMIIIATAAFNAIRRPLPALGLSLARLVLVFYPLALFLGDTWGFTGIFAAIALSNMIIGVVSWWWCRRTLVSAMGSTDK